MASVARQYHTTTTAIAEVNNLADADAALRGPNLIIPITAPKVVAAAATASFSRTPTRYAVRKGDTVLSIADDFGVPADRIRKWNHLHTNTLKPGAKLVLYRPTIPGGGAPSRHASGQHASKHGSGHSSSHRTHPSPPSGKSAKKKHHH